ncbi:hypothetical protein PCANC_19381 [Puccinia coronata f. sp. avenae]|uniref:GAG-pre-integrase domain-containing protein n=1 Tax=Puccinia coronata f. sp. avenae TaxID=200324 RepID=A0A2N5UPH6_9BASI|nr:hypothetical protein PCANC_27439 [Puccinia coronata f. sp. avenae]PLW39658.1 hypothetical protein PCANC_19381 [Puccinia coronata f. sp. avenae]
MTTVERLKINTNFYVPLDMPSEKFNLFDCDLTKDKQCLLYWHCLFGHASLRKIKHMCMHGLGLALPSKLPSGVIKCSVPPTGQDVQQQTVCFDNQGYRDRFLQSKNPQVKGGNLSTGN